MNLKQHYPDMEILFDNLDKLIDAPNGIEKTRELILQLAVQGKLVEQDPNDEPASELLKKIKREKEKLIAEGKIKKQKELPPIKDEDKPFELPKGWEWVRLDHLGVTQTGTTPPTKDPSNYGNFIPFVGPGDILDHKINYKKNGLSKTGLTKGRMINKDSILMVCIGGSIGKCAMNDIDVTCNQQINTITPFSKVNLNFVFYSLNAPYFQIDVVKYASGSATPIINKEKWINLLLPLPPLNEQKRIVEKVNSLMALLDELEEKRERRNKKRIKLNNASLEKLLTSKDDKEQKLNWKRIEENFNTLYSVPENVKKLKQAILQLAVQGKLVKQDPKDEPASELLKKIKKEKEKLITAGKIKKQKELPPIKDEEKPFELPKKWGWSRIGEITNYGISLKTEGTELDDQTWVIELEDIEKVTSRILKKVRFRDKKFKSTKNLFYKGDVIYGKLRPYLDKVVVADEDGVCTTEMIPIRGYSDIDSQYLRLVLKSPYFVEYATDSTHGMSLPRLGTDKARMALIPITPLKEQKRIVEKVNEIMSLCNALEEKLKYKEEEGKRLVGAVVNEVANNTNKTKDDKKKIIKDLITKHSKALKKLG